MYELLTGSHRFWFSKLCAGRLAKHGKTIACTNFLSDCAAVDFSKLCGGRLAKHGTTIRNNSLVQHRLAFLFTLGRSSLG